MYYEATVKTKTVSNNSLEPEIEKHRGKRVNLIRGWRVEEGPYCGQQCYITVPYFGWIPKGELKDMKQISCYESLNEKCKNPINRYERLRG